jgi:hypothetical protein
MVYVCMWFISAIRLYTHIRLSSVMLRGVDWCSATEVTGQRIDSIFQSQSVKNEC